MAQIGTQGLWRAVPGRPPGTGRSEGGGTAAAEAVAQAVALRGPAGKAPRMKRYAGEKKPCKECGKVNTKDPSGVCAACRTFERAQDFIVNKHEAAFYIARPDGFFLMEKPCTFPGMYRFYDRPNASQEVRNMCWQCPAYDWCLEWGIKNPEFGIWGGLGERERKAVRQGGGGDTRQGPAEPPGSLTADSHALVA